MIKIYNVFHKNLERGQISKSIHSQTQSEPILYKETSSTNDYIPNNTQYNSKPLKKEISNGLSSHLTISSKYRKQTSITVYSNKTDKTVKKIVLLPKSRTHHTIKVDRINNTVNSKSLSKNEQLDVLYKKVFKYSLGIHKFKQKFPFDNMANINNNANKKSTEKIINKTKNDTIRSTLNCLNTKIGFMKSVIDYSYPSQFLFKMKESKLLLGTHHKKSHSGSNFTAESILLSVEQNKQKRFKLLKKAFNIQPLPKLLLDNSNSNI